MLQTKSTLRKLMKSKLRQLNANIILDQCNTITVSLSYYLSCIAIVIFQKICKITQYQEAKKVSIFLSMEKEVQTKLIVEDLFSEGLLIDHLF